MCQTCHVARFCSQSCSSTNLKVHQQNNCLKLHSFVETSTDDSAERDVLRMLLSLARTTWRTPDASEVCRISETVRSLSDLMSHKENFSWRPQELSLVRQLYRKVSEFLISVEMKTTFSFDWFLELYGKLIINGFAICDTLGRTVGWGVYLVPSILDHSCVPNANVTFSGKMMRVRTLVDIPKGQLDVSKIRISYIDLMEIRELRQKSLRNRYFFNCDCPRCQGSYVSIQPLPFNNNPNDIPKNGNAKLEELLYSIKCQHCRIGHVFIAPDHDEFTEKVCNHCQVAVGSDTIEKYHKKYVKLSTILESEEEEQSLTLEQLQSEIICTSEIFHDFHIFHLRLKEIAFEEAYKTRNFRLALKFGLALQDAYNTLDFAHSLHALGMFHFRMGFSNRATNEMRKSKDHLEKSYRILARSLGNDNVMVKKICEILNKEA